jgi:Tfp pilus assembly protein PilN
VLVALAEKSAVTICVFRKESLDFIRSIEIGNEVEEAGDYIERCKTEIDAVMQFYDIEVDDAEDKWELSVMFRDMDVDSALVEKNLQDKFGSNISVCSDSTVYFDTIVESNDDISSASLTAVGLAMNPLKTARLDIVTDLVPPEVRNTEAVKKLLLLTANIAVVILLLIFMMSGVVARRFCNIQERVEKINNADMVVSIRHLLGKEKLIESQIACLDDRKEIIDSIFKEDSGIDFWPGILDDISKRIPTNMYIVSIYNEGGQEITIEGKTLSGKAAYRFARSLAESQFVKAANVEEVSDDERHKGVVDYTIRCMMIDNRRLQANAK